MKRELLDQTERSQLIGHLDLADRKAHFEEREDVEPLIRAAEILSDDPPKGEWWRHAGYIPASVFNQAAREGWLHDKKAWKRWLNDPDNKKFRTWKGRV